MNRFEVERLGPIEKAEITFGDLTVLVGPQASGKSLLVQLLKAVRDAGAIRSDLRNYGFDWLHGGNVVRDYCSIFFGGGLGEVIDSSTALRVDGRAQSFEKIAKPPGRATTEETVFFIPAQRVLVLQDGWPRPFLGYSAGDPLLPSKFQRCVAFDD